MASFPEIATRRPVAVWMLFLAVVFLGIISYSRLPTDLLPDISYPRLVIFTSYPDVAPAEIERLVTEPVEAAAAAIPGVADSESVSREGVSLVTLDLRWGTDMDFAMLNLRERMDNVRGGLPESATRPTILRVDPESEPVMTVSVSGGADLWETKELAETVFRRRLEQLEGVAQVAVTGGLDREIQVNVDRALSEAYGISPAQIAQALASANVSSPGGSIMQGRYRYPVRMLGEFQTVEEIRDVIVARETPPAVEGEPNPPFREVRLSDVAEVVDGFADRESVARYDGVESVGLLVFKEAGANTVIVAELVEESLAILGEEYTGVRLDVANSQAGFISDSIDNVVNALVLGGVLAFVVLFFFLRDPRYPVAIALAIPVSVVGTFALMEAFDTSLNIMSLGGLALGVGMLVDNSIVVLENIFRHREELGKGMMAAAADGAREVQGAITASTLTTISVFGPIVYVEGVAGELFEDLSLVVAFSLLTSLVVALSLLPSIASRFALAERKKMKAEVPERAPGRWWTKLGRASLFVLLLLPRAVIALVRFVVALLRFWAGVAARILDPISAAFDRGFEKVASRYHAVLEWSLDRAAAVFLGCVLALAGSAALALSLPRDLLPSVDQGAFSLRLEMEEGTALDATLETASTIEDFARSDPSVDAVFSTVGRDVRAYAQNADATGLHTADLQVRLRDGQPTGPVAQRMRSLAGGLPSGDLSVETGQVTSLGAVLGGSEADVAIRIFAEDLDAAYVLAEEVVERLDGAASLGNVRIGSERGQPQIQIEIDHDACASYGISPQAVSEAVGNAMQGNVATEFVDFDRKIRVVVRFPDELRYSRETLDDILVQGVPVRELVHIRDALGPAEIRRQDQGRVIPVYADVVSGGLDQAIAEVNGLLAHIPQSSRLRWEVGGENEEMRRSFRDLTFAFLLALLLVYMILAAQFESFLQPLTILTAVPLALVGAVALLAATGNGLNTMSLIGVVILVGIVVNDAIVKVDFINQARSAGMELRAAILEAGRVRLRPIVMTTVTTVLGLVPMALGIGRGSDLRAPMAIAVIGGLVLATALTLIVVPVVYQTTQLAGRAISRAVRGNAVGELQETG